MASKATVKRQKSAEAVTASGETHKQLISEKVSELYGDRAVKPAVSCEKYQSGWGSASAGANTLFGLIGGYRKGLFGFVRCVDLVVVGQSFLGCGLGRDARPESPRGVVIPVCPTGASHQSLVCGMLDFWDG